MTSTMTSCRRCTRIHPNGQYTDGGFVQYFSIYPFKVHLHLDDQLDLYIRHAKKQQPVLNLDATGSIIKNIHGQLESSAVLCTGDEKSYTRKVWHPRCGNAYQRTACIGNQAFSIQVRQYNIQRKEIEGWFAKKGRG